MIKGKVVIVTGAARGLGQKYIIELAKEGAQVVFADINDCGETEAKVSEITNDYLSLNLDVTEFDSCVGLVSSAVEKFGKVMFLSIMLHYMERLKALDLKILILNNGIEP